MYCTNCGRRIPDNARFCPACGARQIDYSQRSVKTGKSDKKKTALVIGIISFLVLVVLIGVVGTLLFTAKIAGTETKYYVKSTTRYRQSGQKYTSPYDDFISAKGKWDEDKHELDLQHQDRSGNDLDRGVIYQYDEYGNEIEMHTYPRDVESEYLKRTTEYDKDGRIIKINRKNGNDEFIRQWFYDKKGILNKYTKSTEDEETGKTIGFEISFEYDQDSSPYKGDVYVFEGTDGNIEKTLLGRLDYSFDEQGNLIREAYYSEETDNVSYESYVEWDYDYSHNKNGVRKECRVYIGSELNGKAEYDENGCYTHLQTFDFETGEPDDYYTEYEYGEYQGRTTKVDNQLAKDLIFIMEADDGGPSDPAEPSDLFR